MDVLDCHAQIEGAAKKAKHEVRVHRKFPLGAYAHQGDVYLVRVKDKTPRGARRGSRQVAIGTTVGARHIAEGALTVYESKGFRDFPAFAVGPLVVAEERWTLTHPEHADHECPAGVFQVVYQREGERRVSD